MKHPRIIRHHLSGVWICYVLGPSDLLPGRIRIEGRRVWEWIGGQLETSQLATQGAKAGDKLGDWVANDLEADSENLIDCIETTEAVVEACRGLPVWEPS